MNPLMRQVIILALCLAATVAAKIYVDRMLGDTSVASRADSVTVETR